MDFQSGNGLLALCREHQAPISEVMLQRELALMETDREAVQQRMERAYEIMRDAVRRALCGETRPMGGLIGGEAQKVMHRRETGRTACGGLMSRAVAYAVGVLEVNASMGLIVAAPTAGSSGVLPGVLLALEDEYGYTRDDTVTALYNASAVGYLITRNATVAGARGGCQAEVGSASAMAASAVTELMGGTPEQCLDAAAIAISNLLGLVCDPVGGLVEAPCQQRNAVGASNAMVSAESVLSGVRSLVPFDEMVDVMFSVGRSLPRELRETALGGMAAAPSVCDRCASCG